jgi:serine/threonine protein kinase
VAVKVLADNWSANTDVRNRFLAEARIMRRIHDRRLVQVYDIGTIDEHDGSGGRPYFVMDYVDGGSLNDLRKSGLDPVRALRLCAEAARALEVLHEHDIIHRDVTPGNLLLSVDATGAERVLVADLGVAKSLIDAVGATMTAGTPSYMAPEQASGAVPLDRRADVYSLTAVTYAMLTGKPPFVVSSVSDILRRDPRGAPAPIADQLGAPPSLDAVMQSGLAYDRERRPPTALLLADGLETIARQIATSPDQPATPVWSTPSATSTPPTHPVGPRRPGQRSTSPRPAQPPTGQPTPRPVAQASADPETSGTAAPVSIVGTTYTPMSAQSASPLGPPDADPFGSYGGQPAAMLSTAPPDPGNARSSRAYWLLLILGAAAVFAIALFVTILLLR